MATTDAACRTKQRRSGQLAGVRNTVSGGADAAAVQLQEEIGKEARKKLMADPQFARPISAEESLLMKTSMGLPWHKIRQGRRYVVHVLTNPKCSTYNTYSWFRANGIIIPSERKLRKLSAELLVEDLESEMAPFSFGLKHGGEDLRPAPLVYVADLVAFTLHLLDQNARY